MNPINWKRTGSAMVLIAGLGALLTGCSSSPSSGAGQQAIQNRINEQAQGRIKLTKFEKSNGAQGEMMGFKIYALEFDAEIAFTEDCKWITGMFGQQLSFQTTKPVAKPGSGFSWNSFLDDTTNPGTLVKGGQRVKLSGVIRFVKKEKGWSVDGVELTKADVGNASSAGSPSQPTQAGARQRQIDPEWAVSAAKAQINNFKTLLDVVQIDTGQYPRSLAELISKPSGSQKWGGPYMAGDSIPKDPWGNDYIYTMPGTHNPNSYDLMSMGADGRPGGGDDITNW